MAARGDSRSGRFGTVRDDEAERRGRARGAMRGAVEEAERGPRVIVVPGARAAEARLLRELDAELDAARHDRSLLARPLRVVVPSASLRGHLAARLVRRREASLVGIEIQTHRTLAREAVENAGGEPPRGAALLSVLARRACQAEPLLRDALGGLPDGASVLTATLRDFFDAGFESVHASPLEECAGHELGGERGERAAAVVRAARRVADAFKRLGLAPDGDVFALAVEALARFGPELLPTRALWIHGFADATGRSLDWLGALLATYGGRALVSRPPDPVRPERREATFVQPFLDRLLATGAELSVDEGAVPPQARLAFVTACGVREETACVAHRIRALLDAGCRPEDILVAVRSWAPYRGTLRLALERLGVPFSAPGTAEIGDAVGRRSLALLDLLRLAERTPVDRWLDAAKLPGAAAPRLRAVLRTLGVSRVADLADLDDARLAGDERPAAPANGADAETYAPPRAPRPERRGQRADFDRLRRFRAYARDLRAQLAERPRRAPLRDHLRWLEELLRGHLAWREDEADRSSEALDALARELPAELGIEDAEFALLVERALEQSAPAPVGGAGAGVQVLTVMEARGRTAQHLFVLGLNRGVFPRAVSEDPLLGDEARRRLRDLLPELPVKARGREEERHLFADLLEASANVTLLAQRTDEEGRERPLSPLVMRLVSRYPEWLRDWGREAEPDVARDPRAEPASEGSATPEPLCAPHERAVELALASGPRGLARALPAALAHARREREEETPSDAIRRLASVRLAVLRELDRGPWTAGRLGLGPYFGFVGGEADTDPERPLGITRLEALARCPWQAFLQHELRLEPARDAAGELPASDTRLAGSVVHRVLERLVERELGESPRELADLAGRSPIPVSWPEPPVLEALLEEAIEAIAKEEGHPHLAASGALRARARAALAAAREADWSEAPPAVLGTEVNGELTVEDARGRLRRVSVRADRVDAVAGGVRITDYKTGKPDRDASNGAKRREALLRRVREGELLQGCGYLEAARGTPALGPALARYLFLSPRASEDQRELIVPGDEEPWRRSFLESCGRIFAARELGVRFPRLLERDGSRDMGLCASCDVRLACVRGESSLRTRLREWVEHHREGASGLARHPAERALLALWQPPQEAGAADAGAGSEGGGE